VVIVGAPPPGATTKISTSASGRADESRTYPQIVDCAEAVEATSARRERTVGRISQDAVGTTWRQGGRRVKIRRSSGTFPKYPEPPPS
jgi:hypothetical protein